MSGINLARRAFFGKAAAAAAIGPSIVAGQIKQLSEFANAGYGHSMGSSVGPASMSAGRSKLATLLLSGKPPQWKLDEIRQECRYEARQLDPDLIVNRSMSLSARYVVQFDRCVKRRIESESMWQKIASARNKFFGDIL